MIIITSGADIAHLHEFLPTERLGVVCELTFLEQDLLLRKLSCHDNYTHLLFNTALTCVAVIEVAAVWLKSLPRLSHLSIINTKTIPIHIIENFCYTISQSLSIQHLDLSGLCLGPEGAYYVAQALQNSAIHSLRVANNNIQASGCMHLLKCDLRHLCLDDNNIHPKSWRRCFEKATVQLKKVELPGHTFDETSIVALGHWLNRMQLTHLNLNRTNVNGELLKILCAAIKHHPTLLSLKLCECDLDDYDMMAIYKLIQQNTVLRTLLLERNPILLRGQLALICGLQKNFTLKTLGLDPIPDYAGGFLAPVLKMRKELEPGETPTGHIIRLLSHNRELNLANSFWTPKNHFFHPRETQLRVLFVLWLLKKKNIPYDIVYHILSFWYGVQRRIYI
jgi:hypothetical protein